jgi:hypothetical protein
LQVAREYYIVIGHWAKWRGNDLLLSFNMSSAI